MADKVIPYVSPETTMTEFTIRALIVGVIISVVMGAANAYLGLKVGLTVSASIPAAVISLAIFKALKGTILEITVAKTTGAAGESLAAGIIFTIPALLMVGAWDGLDIVMTTMIALCGGILGVFFTISLRRILIEDLDLPFPEGVAAKEVLVAGEEGGKSAKDVFVALGLGALFKIGSSLVADGKEYSLGLWTDKVQGAISVGKTKLYFGSELSLALLGVGYIIGLRISGMILIGGAIGWMVLAPLFILFEGAPYNLETGLQITDPILMFNAIREQQLVFMGVGAMIVGSFHTLFKLRTAIVDGVKSAMSMGKKGEEKEEVTDRTQDDLSIKWSYLSSIILMIPMAGIYYLLSGSILIAVLSAIVMVLLAFLFTTVAGYLAGIVGSSNNPISGITIATLLFTSIFIYILGGRGVQGMSVAIGVGAIVCISAAIAGDVMQSLKTGQLIGSTPKYLQLGEFTGVIAAAFIIPPILLLLDNVYGIGSVNLPAPQALAMKSIVEGIFAGGMNWLMVILGMQFALLLIILKKPVLPIAIGLYLPFSLGVPIVLGGLVKTLVDKRVDDLMFFTSKKNQADQNSLREKVHVRGILYSSGLIAGEALMGVIIAAFVTTGISLALIPSPVMFLGLPIIGLGFFLYMAFKLKQMGDEAVDELMEEET